MYSGKKACRISHEFLMEHATTFNFFKDYIEKETSAMMLLLDEIKDVYPDLKYCDLKELAVGNYCSLLMFYNDFYRSLFVDCYYNNENELEIKPSKSGELVLDLYLTYIECLSKTVINLYKRRDEALFYPEEKETVDLVEKYNILLDIIKTFTVKNSVLKAAALKDDYFYNETSIYNFLFDLISLGLFDEAITFADYNVSSEWEEYGGEYLRNVLKDVLSERDSHNLYRPIYRRKMETFIQYLNREFRKSINVDEKTLSR